MNPTKLKQDNEIEQVKTLVQKRDYYETGKKLQEIKKRLGSDDFKKWIKDNFRGHLELKEAYLNIRIFKNFEDHPEAVKSIPRQFLVRLVGTSFPDEARELIVEDMDEVADEKLREISFYYQLMKQRLINEKLFLWLVEHIAKQESTLEKQNINRKVREHLYKNIQLKIAGLDVDDLKKARKMAWLFPYDPDDPNHNETISKIERQIKMLKKLKKELNGGVGILKPVSTENGTEYQ